MLGSRGLELLGVVGSTINHLSRSFHCLVRMLKEDAFWDLWEEHKEWLLKTCGCFRENRRFRYASSHCESQFEGLEYGWPSPSRLSKEVHQGITFQIEKRIRGYNFTLPVVDAMQKENVRFPPDFIQGFRLGLYTFINYKTTQELNEVFQVMFDAGL